jgi:hypothetical protein
VLAVAMNDSSTFEPVDVSPFVTPTPRKRRCRAKAQRNHNPRVGGSSPSFGITKCLENAHLEAAQLALSSGDPVALGSGAEAEAQVDEIVAVMRQTSDDRHGWRVRAMIVVLWRAGLRIQEALALAEHDLNHRRGSILIRNGKGGRRREVGMDEWAWEQLRPWLNARLELPVGPLFCIIDGPTHGRPWSGAAVRSEFRRLAPALASGGASPRTSCVSRMRSSSPTRACR